MYIDCREAKHHDLFLNHSYAILFTIRVEKRVHSGMCKSRIVVVKVMIYMTICWLKKGQLQIQYQQETTFVFKSMVFVKRIPVARQCLSLPAQGHQQDSVKNGCCIMCFINKLFLTERVKIKELKLQSV